MRLIDADNIPYSLTKDGDVVAYPDAIAEMPTIEAERKKGKWVVVTRHEHYPSGKPYGQLRCPFCKRFDHNGDGNFCGYCGAKMEY